MQKPRSLALLGMTTSQGLTTIWDSVRNLADLSVNDSSALPAIAFVTGSAVYLYRGLCSAAVLAAVVGRLAHPARAGYPRDSQQDADATNDIDAF
jgi:hypothetical protein